jgi:hypothetical protein
LIDTPQLLADLTRHLKRLEDDLRARVAEVPELKAALAGEWQTARDAERTAETFESWADQVITQAGVHWLLSCVFLRFIEDNQLAERPWLSGSHDSGRLALAQDRHEAYFRMHPLESDRDYLLAAFREAGALPGLNTFFDETHNPLFRLGISGDAAMALRQFWQQRDPNTGALVHDFTDSEWNTRFLGDLYQDLSEEAKKRYALLQTPEFVEEFILDRTLTPAIHEFGFREVRLIDPTCGSGHFLLGAFGRLVDEWARNEPGRNLRDVAQKALDAVAGVDLNPFAVAIARFRLLVAALKVSEVHRLADAPNFRINVAIGDSLLHGSRFGLTRSEAMFEGGEHYAGTGLAHAYASEDLSEVQRILGLQYHAVVGNPPYITVKDKALNEAYRQRYISCHRKYSLGAPFTERFFELAVTGNGQPAGYVGLITANSFMKREFGSKLIEEVLPRLDLTHVIDTSGAYIPGHGTPTVVLFGRDRMPVGNAVRTVMGIKGEPSTPDDPAHGLVWLAITGQIDRAGSQSEFVSVADMPRATFAKHPWSIGGGGAAELLEQIEQSAKARLESVIGRRRFTVQVGERQVNRESLEIGFAGFSGADDHFISDRAALYRRGVPHELIRPMVLGDGVRDWSVDVPDAAFVPYDDRQTLVPLDSGATWYRWLWPSRTALEGIVSFGGKTQKDLGAPWWGWYRWVGERYAISLTITYAEVASHNHFVLDRGGKVFNQTAPVIKLPAGSSEDEHLALIGLLNSSTVCFWLKQVSHQKQMMGGDGVRISDRSKVPYQFASTRVQELPLPADWLTSPDKPLLVRLAAAADALARDIAKGCASDTIEQALCNGQGLHQRWQAVLEARKQARSNLILIQEEIDFLVYHMYGLVDDRTLLSPMTDWNVTVEPGSRPFCILEQKNADGFAVPTSVPIDWPADLRDLWNRRIDAIKSQPSIRVIEDAHYKRRWIGRQGLFNHDAKSDEFSDALRVWMLDRLEASHLWRISESRPPQIVTTNRLADSVRTDANFLQVAELYAGHANFDLDELIAELVAAECVPFLSVLRYKDSGQRKRAQWEDTWALQRREDAGESVGKIPVPPKYEAKDFLKSDIARLRGPLDVPKERWISYPGSERGADTSLPIAWAGWSHLQQATALASYYFAMKDTEGWESARLQPLLAGLLELVPWLKQWHNELDPVYGERMGDYYEGFVRDEARAAGVTLEELKAWKPAAATTRRRRTRVAAQ